MIIYQSFEDWNNNPVKTTIDTRPMVEIKFPKVTVCPPKNTYTDLNYDLMMTENMTLDDKTRKILLKYAMDILYTQVYENVTKENITNDRNNTKHFHNSEERLFDHLYETLKTNMSMLTDNDKYFNWYFGYTEIRKPFYFNQSLHFILNSHSKNGTISNINFKDNLRSKTIKNQGNVSYVVKVYPPAYAKYNENVTLHFDGKNFTLPREDCYLYQSIDRFNLTWYYSDIKEYDDDGVAQEEDPHYSNDENTVAFVRYAECGTCYRIKFHTNLLQACKHSSYEQFKCCKNLEYCKRN